MCGIVAYFGTKAAQPALVEGLKRLEYRGYDSAGVALLNGEGIKVWKTSGRIAALERILEKPKVRDCLGIGHTRWATHGEPNTVNAHPHLDWTRRIAVVHNGIIENFAALRSWLRDEGIPFISETDSEVIANMIGYFYSKTIEKDRSNGQTNFEWAVQQALQQLQGAFGLAVLCADDPEVLIGARRGSPLILGVGDREYVLASDAAAIIEHTTKAVYLADNEMVTIDSTGFQTKTLTNVTVSKELQEIEYSLDELELGIFPHYMLKEIHEQPQALGTCLRGRLDTRNGKTILGGIGDRWRDLANAKHIISVACGTAYHAGMVGSYMIEQLARRPARAEYASEFRYRNPLIEERTVVIAISQSGETADTLAAVDQAKERGATVLGIVNAVGSTIARTTDAGVYLHVGPEIGVASTKAFTGQVSIMAMLAVELGRRSHLSHDVAGYYIDELAKIPEKMEKVLQQTSWFEEIVRAVVGHNNWLFLGRGVNYPVALEGALKLKEISYIHSEGMPAAEMKHGPIALIVKGMPVVFIATKGPQYEKTVGNIEEVRARGGHTIVVATEGDRAIQQYADHLIEVPDVPELLQPLLTVIPLQLIAYYAAVLRGHDVDKPRNLAKSVTVE